MKKGFIFSARHRAPEEAIHPIIFWEMNGSYEFVGLMITHATAAQFGNLYLSDNSYFYEKRKQNEFDGSLVVQALLIKPIDWLINPRKRGQLSKKGIDYVEGIVKDMMPITWDIYKSKIL